MDAAILTTAGVVIAALLGVIGTLMGLVLRTARRTHEQVANNHVDAAGQPVNMRDDLDEKFHGLADLVKGVAKTVQLQAADIGGIRHELRTLRDNDNEHTRQANRDRERIDSLERTVPRDELGRFVSKDRGDG